MKVHSIRLAASSAVAFVTTSPASGYASASAPSAGHFLRKDASRSLLEGGEPPCVDTLAVTRSSPIKDCAEAVTSFPCDGNVFGTSTNVVDVCRKTCGLCGGTDAAGRGEDAAGQDEAEGGASTGGAGFVARLDRQPPSETEYSVFNVTADFVEVTMHVPSDMNWFGFNFYTFNQAPGDEKAAGGYTFQIKRDRENFVEGRDVEISSGDDAFEYISYESWYLNFFGTAEDVVEELGITSPVWECPVMAKKKTDICEYDEEKEVGDIMLSLGSGGLLLGLRSQPLELRDIDILSASLDDDGEVYTIVWRRSRYAPFDGNGEITYRYASSRRDHPEKDFYPPVRGLDYHGFNDKFYGTLALGFGAASDDVEDGPLQNERLADDPSVLVIGGDNGWDWRNVDDPKYPDVTAELGDTLRFTYPPYIDVATLPSAEALEECDLTDAQVISGSDIPFDLKVDEGMARKTLYLTTSYTSSFTGKATGCEQGMKLTVNVLGYGQEDPLISEGGEADTEEEEMPGQVNVISLGVIRSTHCIFALATILATYVFA